MYVCLDLGGGFAEFAVNFVVVLQDVMQES